MINGKNEKDNLYEAVTGLLIRVSALEQILINKGTISKEEYFKQLSGSVQELQGIAEAAALAKRDQKKILS